MKLALLGIPVLAAGLAAVPAPAQAGTDVGIRIDIGHRGDRYRGEYRRDSRRHRCRENRDHGYCKHQRRYDRRRGYHGDGYSRGRDWDCRQGRYYDDDYDRGRRRY